MSTPYDPDLINLDYYKAKLDELMRKGKNLPMPVDIPKHHHSGRNWSKDEKEAMQSNREEAHLLYYSYATA